MAQYSPTCKVTKHAQLTLITIYQIVLILHQLNNLVFIVYNIYNDSTIYSIYNTSIYFAQHDLQHPIAVFSISLSILINQSILLSIFVYH